MQPPLSGKGVAMMEVLAAIIGAARLLVDLVRLLMELKREKPTDDSR